MGLASVGGEEGPLIGGDREFGARLARAIRVVTAKAVCLAIATSNASVFVAFVARHDYGRARMIDVTESFEQADGADKVYLMGPFGVRIGTANKRLRGQMK